MKHNKREVSLITLVMGATWCPCAMPAAPSRCEAGADDLWWRAPPRAATHRGTPSFTATNIAFPL